MNIDTIALSDTIGIATPELVNTVFSNLLEINQWLSSCQPVKIDLKFLNGFFPIVQK